MNEMKPLEAQLKSWMPRRPSAALERKLFGAPAPRPPPARCFGWLAPAAACLLVVGAMVHQRGGTTLSIAPDHEELVAMSLSNQSYAAYLPGSFQREQNRWDTFEWTRGRDFNFSKHPFPQGRTNDAN
jgi:hypothetical protein